MSEVSATYLLPAKFTNGTTLGTSIGALIGGLYAREGDILSSAGRAKHFSSRMGNIWRILSDVTYPIGRSYLPFQLDPQHSLE